MENKALRYDQGKLNVGLIPIPALLELSMVFTKGAVKYDPENWRKGMLWSRVYTPMMRHFFKWLLGQQRDKENRCHHLLQVAWGCVVLYMYERWACIEEQGGLQLKHLLNDDRPDKMTDEEIDALFNVVLTDMEEQFLKDKKEATPETPSRGWVVPLDFLDRARQS